MFSLYVQPITRVSDQGEATFYEVLLRLNIAGKLMEPTALIATAERLGGGGIQAIDRWVIDHVFDFSRRLRRGKWRDTKLFINLSGQSISDIDFCHHIVSLLDIPSVPSLSVCFEITETAAVTNLAHAQAFIQHVRARGCSVALDDFGTGMSSYHYLKLLPVDYLKIDGIFIRKLTSDAVDYEMVHSMSSVAHLMNLQTIAEHVETEDTMPALTRLGIDFTQGYAIAPPMPLREVFGEVP